MKKTIMNIIPPATCVFTHNGKKYLSTTYTDLKTNVKGESYYWERNTTVEIP